MLNETQLEPTIIAIIGAGGDLTWRKLMPALYNLMLDKYLPEKFAIIGAARKKVENEAFRQHLREGVEHFSRRGTSDDALWQTFSDQIFYVSEDMSDSESGRELNRQFEAIEARWGGRSNRVYYLAIPPTMMEMAARMMERLGVCKNCTRDRIVIEKPFGRDLASARGLNRFLDGIFDESQIYRIDHYLGKETVQNILAFRFANSLFEPVWNRRYIDHVQITVAETVGVESRGEYFDNAGVLRDMVQNHLLQILCLIAMEPPISFDAEEIRNKKVDVLHAIRPIRAEDMDTIAVRGQYSAGNVGGKPVPGYREEKNIAKNSTTETYAALRFNIDNWRWQGVPFYLRTGKRLPVKVSEITIIFHSPPHQFFPAAAVENWQPNRIVMRIQPEEGIFTRIQVKHPGTRLLLGAAEMQFRYSEAFRTATPDAYETLLLDIIRGDATLFMRADQVECAWGIVAPVLDSWGAPSTADVACYPAGSWGPEAAERLIARDGHRWIQPSVTGETA